MSIPPVNFNQIREGLAALPRAENHRPGALVQPESVYTVQGHRAALDPDRPLVVGNRGMGKSFWAHALAQPEARESAARTLQQPVLRTTDVVIGFNASEKTDQVAPTPAVIAQLLKANVAPDSVWRAVLARSANSVVNGEMPSSFLELVHWIESDAERFGELMTQADTLLSQQRRRLLIVFDALDRVGADWNEGRALTKALLRQALASQSYRSIRLKLFMRLDQFSDAGLFDFPDASKVRNTRVDLEWSTTDLYGLLLHRLAQSPAACDDYRRLREDLASTSSYIQLGDIDQGVGQRSVVNAIAGEFMGAQKRGFVFTWLPTHLADARGQTSPRTFLTAWREAANHNPPPLDKAVDHTGLLEGVRKASEDRLSELAEDYPWIKTVLEPLRGQMVPMELDVLEGLWRDKGTVDLLMRAPARAPVQLVAEDGHQFSGGSSALMSALQTIGVLELRSNGKINVPDIFRVEAGIKRKGGVRLPRRGAA